MRSLERIVDILDKVADSTDGCMIGELAEATGLPISTVSRFVHSMCDARLLEKTRDGRFVIGMRIAALGHLAEEQNPLFMRARPHMVRLRDQTGETVSLHVPYLDLEKVCVGEVRSQRPVSRAIAPGTVRPLVETVSGEIMLVDEDPDQLDERLRRAGLTATQTAEVIDRVAGFREQGWGFADQWVDGVAAVAVPIRQRQEVVASLAVSGPSYRFTREEAREQIGHVLEAAEAISAVPQPRPS